MSLLKNIKVIFLILFILILSSCDTVFKKSSKTKFVEIPIKTNSKTIDTNDSQNVLDENAWITNTNIQSGGDKRATKGGMITIVGGAEFPATLRSLGKDSRNQMNSLMTSLQYESLLLFDYENLVWSPALATHWQISEDKMTYWFKINPRARWSDGREVIAEDVVATFKLIMDDGHKDPNVAIQNKELFYVPIAESKYIVRIDAKKEDWRTFRNAAGTSIMPSYYLNKVDGTGYLEKYDNAFMPGSGPYKYDAKKSKKGNEGYIIMKSRDDYWAKNDERNIGLYNFDTIKFIIIEDDNQQMLSFFRRDFDIYFVGTAQHWAEKFTEKDYTEIKNGWVQKIKVFNYLPSGPSGIVFNTQKKPYDDVRVRKALAYLWDVDKLNQRLFFNEYDRLNTFFYGTPYANPNNPMLEYNPQKAKELLNEIGWSRKDGNQWMTNSDGEIFEFDFLIYPSWVRIFITYQEDLKKVGIKMNFDQVDGSAKFKKIMKKEYEVSNMGWTGGFFPSPEGLMHSKYADKLEVTNITSMDYPELDTLIEQYNAEWDAKKRVPLAHQIDSIAVNSFHYAMGWTAPYGARMMYWNKFGIPESGIGYVGDWKDPLQYWWIDKNNKLDDSIKQNKKMPIKLEIIDYWNRFEHVTDFIQETINIIESYHTKDKK